ncbi:MAG: DUF4430 domain-containing protein [Candidatus Thalassarchaeaceae archaeon]|nr:MAG: hypothetical protein CND84_00280 [Marine Group II euryarchaeote MED-G35]
MSDFLKPASVVALLALIAIAPSIQDNLSAEASKFIDDNESAHDGLPTQWEGKQVICVHFPASSSHDRFSQGVTMIGADGSDLGANQNLNRTGACVGGFEGYSNGLDFMMDSTRVASGDLSVGYDVGQWGHFVHTIGGLNADTMTGDFNGAYWNLDHNGATSTVGIGDLVMSEGDVISWGIDTW